LWRGAVLRAFPADGIASDQAEQDGEQRGKSRSMVAGKMLPV
jgi:hypothetical protein